jgi:hypothetical protein
LELHKHLQAVTLVHLVQQVLVQQGLRLQGLMQQVLVQQEPQVLQLVEV